MLLRYPKNAWREGRTRSFFEGAAAVIGAIADFERIGAPIIKVKLGDVNPNQGFVRSMCSRVSPEGSLRTCGSSGS